MGAAAGDNQAFRRFLRRTWQEEVAPLLRDHYARQRRRTARTAGKVAATTGLLVDTVFGLKGKPFARFMTVVGSRLGALLPDVWSWSWLRESASAEERQTVADRMRRRAACLPETEALALFGLTPVASRQQLKQAWREVVQRWHPDKARDEKSRAEYHLRLVTYKAAYERLWRAYDEGRLPLKDA